MAQILAEKGQTAGIIVKIGNRLKKSIKSLKSPKNCLKCEKRSLCKEICPEIEAQLPKPRSGGHKKELTFDPAIMDKIVLNERGTGRRRKPVRYNDNWENE